MPDSMKTGTTNQVLECVAKITESADREALYKNLIDALVQLKLADFVCSSEVVFAEGRLELKYMGHVIANGELQQYLEKRPIHCPLENEPLLMSCFQHGERVESKVKTGDHLAIPLLGASGEVVHIIEMYTSAVKSQAQQLLSRLFEIAQNYLRLIDESERDTLTGLRNRRTFDRNLSRMLAFDSPTPDMCVHEIDQRIDRRHAHDSKNWLAVADVDHFKKINDNFGHLYGDEVLLLLAKIMRGSFRSYDKLFRFGGEEFVIILKHADADGAYAALERFRSNVEGYLFPQVGKVTISVGFVEIGINDVPSDALGKADDALYHAKDHGRNQVCHYQSLLESGSIMNQAVSGDIELF